MLSIEGWLSFISIISVMVIGSSLGLRLIYESAQKQVRLLSFAGIMILVMSFVYLGPLIDFLTIFLTGSNYTNKEILAILSNIWVGPIFLTEGYVFIVLIAPRYKTYFIAYNMISCFLLEFFLLLNPLGSIRVILSASSNSCFRFWTKILRR